MLPGHRVHHVVTLHDIVMLFIFVQAKILDHDNVNSVKKILGELIMVLDQVEAELEKRKLEYEGLLIFIVNNLTHHLLHKMLIDTTMQHCCVLGYGVRKLEYEGFLLSLTRIKLSPTSLVSLVHHLKSGLIMYA